MSNDGWGYPLKPTNDRKKDTKEFITRIRNTAQNYDRGGIMSSALQSCADRIEELQEENDTLRATLMKMMEDNTTKPTEK
jgi:hypothetical protein